MWAVFWANYRPSLKAASKKSKLHFLQSSVAAIARFKWSRWPWQPTYARRLDQVQTQMVALLLPCVQAPSEDPDAFFRCRSLLSGRLASTTGRWSIAWAKAVCRWHDHCLRARDERNWNAFIYKYRCEEWLTQRRVQNSRRGEAARTNTRASHGKVTRRYFEGYSDAFMAGY